MTDRKRLLQKMEDAVRRPVPYEGLSQEIVDLQIRATAIHADNCDSPVWDKILAPMRPYVPETK